MTAAVETETKVYVGIADAHGIESFREYEDGDHVMNGLVLRAAANRQRHAVVYRAEVGANAIKCVEDMISEDDYVVALDRLKMLSTKMELVVTPGDTEETVTKSFDMLPNPALDPYHSCEEL